MSEINMDGKEISLRDIYLKPPIYREVKRIIDDYYSQMNKRNANEFIDIFKNINDVVERCIIVCLFEKYGNISNISKETKMKNELINKHIKSCGLESLYGASHVGGREVK